MFWKHLSFLDTSNFREICRNKIPKNFEFQDLECPNWKGVTVIRKPNYQIIFVVLMEPLECSTLNKNVIHFMLFIRRIKTLEKEKKQTQKTLKNNENKRFDYFF